MMIAIGPEEVQLMQEFLLELSEELPQEKSEDYRDGYAEGVKNLCGLFEERWKMFVQSEYNATLLSDEEEWIVETIGKGNEDGTLLDGKGYS